MPTTMHFFNGKHPAVHTSMIVGKVLVSNSVSHIGGKIEGL